MQAHPVALPRAEKELRVRLLKSNAELRSLYTQLVSHSHILSDEEFWAQHKAMLDVERAKSDVASGIPNSLLPTIKRASEEAGNVRFTLTPPVIQRIFLEYPYVKRAFDDLVPHKVADYSSFCIA